MRVLVVSDEIVPWLYSASIAERVGEVDLVISCGDLPIYYLEYIASALNRPCAYVRGNHDQYEFGASGEIKRSPEGWMPLDMSRLPVAGVAVGGLDGCLRYKPDSPHQYSQSQQWLRAFVLAAHCLWDRIRHGRGLDILVTHAPPFGIHNGPDHAHTGFHAHNWLIQWLRPRYVLHGHQHRNYAPLMDTETQVNGTTVLNAHPYRILDMPSGR